ncbi:MAG TPA: BolA/IbaG family iron-sulfur metabolism protein [Myxococcota bacterium]|nr:BolA/IbaG family iron-sulfur metabolism protein [Myxococcota bacterium]
MTLQILSSPGERTQQLLKQAIEQAIPGATVEVRAGGAGHFELRVEARALAGQTRVAQQRAVYAAIRHLMQGDTAPVHAIDKLEILAPPT